MQTHEDIKRARRPERPAQVTAKKETVLSPEPVHNFKDHREIIARKHRKANRRREVFLARLAAGAALVLVVTVTVSLVSCSKKKRTGKRSDSRNNRNTAGDYSHNSGRNTAGRLLLRISDRERRTSRGRYGGARKIVGL